MNEEIINVVTGLVRDGIAAPTYWIAVFSYKRVILLNISKDTDVELASPLTNRITSDHEVEEIAASFKTMTVEQVASKEYEKVVFSADQVNALQVIERPDSFFRSVIKFPFAGKHIKLSTNRENIRLIKTSLHTINPQVFSDIKPLHSENYKRNISYLIRAIGLIIFFWNVAELFDKIGVKEIFLAVSGIFIFFKKEIGLYILTTAIVIDFILMKLFVSRIDTEDLLRDIIALAVLVGILMFLWKSRSQLK